MKKELNKRGSRTVYLCMPAIETSAPGAEEFTYYSRGDRESWVKIALFDRSAVEQYVRAECGGWVWDGENGGRIWREEARPLEEIPGDLRAEWLTGWTGHYGAPGQAFADGGYATVGRYRVSVRQSGGLDI